MNSLSLTVSFFLLIFGFAFLIKGADYLIKGASSLAKRLKVSDLVIGLTIVALGTSAPELVVNIVASIQGNSDIALGNIIGSNIINILFILGIAAMISPLRVSSGTAWKEIPLALLAVLILFTLANDTLINQDPLSIVSRIDGIILLGFLAIFIYYTFSIARVKGEQDRKCIQYSMWVSLFFIVLGLLGLLLGGKWVVDQAVILARWLGVSETLVGLTVVAIGTSLPELATSTVAAYRKNFNIAIGNIVGSNIINILGILAVSAIIHPLTVPEGMNMDLSFLILTTLLLFLALFIGKRHILERWQGVTFLGLYVLYLIFLVIRG